MTDTKQIGYRNLLTETNYIRYFIASIINRFGDSIDALAFAWMVYEITGDRAWSALIFGLNSLPSILLMPLCGVLVERLDKRRVMIFTDLGRAALVSIIGVLYMLRLAQPWMLAVSTFLMSSLEALRIPAGLAAYPHIIPKAKYTVATSFSQSCQSIATILGTGAFGLIVATGGLHLAMFINAASFIVSSFFIRLLKLPPVAAQSIPLTLRTYGKELKSGFLYLYNKKVLFMICLLGSALGVLLTPISSLQTPYVRESLGQGELALSVISIATMVGTMLGTALFPMINRRAGKSRLFVAGGLLMGAGYLLYVLIAQIVSLPAMFVTLAACSFGYGLGEALVQVVVNVAFMEQVDSGYISRVGSIFNAMAATLTPFASFFVAAIAKVLTVNQIFLIFSAVMVVLFGVMAFNRLLKNIDSPINTEAKETAS